jgi:uncharacterized protein YcsI (UPF0317 family)
LDFMVFAQRNSASCPLLAVLEPGEPIMTSLAPGADLRTDVTRYRVFSRGDCVAEPTSASAYWREDLMTFVIGCTGSFEAYIVKAGIRLRHLEEGKTVPVYVTNRPSEPAGDLHGPMAVSMRPIHTGEVARVSQLTARFPAFHGAPLQVGDADALGVDLDKPAYGDRLTLEADEVPVFWACSVTPQLVATAARVEYMVTNFPNHMLITDVATERMAVLA